MAGEEKSEEAGGRGGGREKGREKEIDYCFANRNLFIPLCRIPPLLQLEFFPLLLVFLGIRRCWSSLVVESAERENEFYYTSRSRQSNLASFHRAWSVVMGLILEQFSARV